MANIHVNFTKTEKKQYAAASQLISQGHQLKTEMSSIDIFDPERESKIEDIMDQIDKVRDRLDDLPAKVVNRAEHYFGTI